MKNIITLLLVFCISLTQCNAQQRKSSQHKKNITKTTKKMNPYQYLITKDFEKFDSVTFNQRENESLVYQYISSNGNYVEMLSHTYKEYIKNSYFVFLKGYYPNDNIKYKGIYSNQEFQIGIWYEFDKDGKFVKEINYDKGYDFTFDNVVAYCEKEGIHLEKGRKKEYYPVVRKDSVGERKFWIIEYPAEGKPSQIDKQVGDKRYFINVYEQIVLDGNTGKVISKKTIGLDENTTEESYKEGLKPSTSQRSGSFLAEPDEIGTSQKEELGKAYTSTNTLPANTHQIYEGKAYTKTEWEDFKKTLPWWDRIL